MIVLKLIRMVLCLGLTMVVWPFLFATILIVSVAPDVNPDIISPAEVYRWFKQTITDGVKAVIKFFADELD